MTRKQISRHIKIVYIRLCDFYGKKTDQWFINNLSLSSSRNFHPLGKPTPNDKTLGKKLHILLTIKAGSMVMFFLRGQRLGQHFALTIKSTTSSRAAILGFTFQDWS